MLLNELIDPLDKIQLDMLEKLLDRKDKILFSVQGHAARGPLVSVDTKHYSLLDSWMDTRTDITRVDFFFIDEDKWDRPKLSAAHKMLSFTLGHREISERLRIEKSTDPAYQWHVTILREKKRVTS